MKKKLKKWGKVIIYNLVVVFLIFAAIEWYLNSKLNNPESCPKWLFEALKDYHQEQDWNIIQMNPNCAHYDSTLFYVLNSGSFTFEDREFSTTYDVNSAGMRDDEESLLQPKDIVLGDSYAMGWGVEQEETFAQLLENQLGTKVLNSAISSYCTAREIHALSKVNTDSLAYLIIQYCPNDIGENKQYIFSNHSLHVSSPEIYKESSKAHMNRSGYYFLKHVLNIPSYLGEKDVVKATGPVKLSEVDKINAEKAFLDIIRDSPHIPATTKIIVFNIEAERSANYFITKVKEWLDKEFTSSLNDRISFIDFTGKIDSSHRFLLDPHLNAKGHVVIANEIISHINQPDTSSKYKEWKYDNGSKSVTCQYQNGLKHGEMLCYWQNGVVSRVCNYVNGVKEGKQIDFSASGIKVNEKS